MGVGKHVTKGAYGILDLVTKPIYEQMKKERKLELRREKESWKKADEDVRVEAMQPRRFEVHQTLDPIIVHKSIW